MKLAIRLGSLLKEELGTRGLIQEIADYTSLERHTVANLLRNSARYVSLDGLGRICDFLISRRNIDPAILPGALLAKEPSGFWSMLDSLNRFEFCLATREHPDWPGIDYVMANDAHLQGVLLSHMSAKHVPTASPEAGVDPVHPRHFPDPHLVPAPRRVQRSGGAEWATIVEGHLRAREIHAMFKHHGVTAALIALGSIKVNILLEIILGEIWSAATFTSEDDVVSPDERRCPIYFRYRPTDPAPVSLCGGTRLSQKHPPEAPGIYYETEDGSWQCVPCEEGDSDAAFVVYAYRPHLDEVQLACGGFSGLATRCLSTRFRSVAEDLWPPQFRSQELEVGMYLVKFTFKRPPARRGGAALPVDFTHEVIPLHPDVLQRRLAPAKPDEDDDAAATPRQSS